MGGSFSRAALLAFAFALAAADAGQVGGQTDGEPLERRIARAIEELGHPQWKAREAAQEFLWSAGRAAEPALRGALKSGDLEVVQRARSVLDKFQWGIYPDTPPEILELIHRYRSGDRRIRQEVIQSLVEKGANAIDTLESLAAAEEDAALRAVIWRHLEVNVLAQAPEMLLKGDLVRLESLLRATAVPASLSPGAAGASRGGGSSLLTRHYIAWLLLRGKLDEKLVREYADAAKTVQEGPERQRVAEFLVYLHRARGDPDQVRKVAEDMKVPELLELVLYEQGDWKRLAAIQAERAGDSAKAADVQTLGYLAAYRRLSGDTKGSAEMLAALEKLADGEKGEVWPAAEALLLNDRCEAAIRLLVRRKEYWTAFRLLTRQGRYAEAFRLVDQARKEKHEKLFDIELEAARVLDGLGEEQQAREILSRLGSGLEDEADPKKASRRLHALIGAECELGLTDRALRRCADALARMQKDPGSWGLVDALLPTKRLESKVWWMFFRRKLPEQTERAVLERVWAVLDDKAPPVNLSELADQAAGFVGELKNFDQGRWQAPIDPIQWLEAIADTCRAAKKPDLALKYLQMAEKLPNGARLRKQVADLLCERERWVEAAEMCRRAHADHPSDAAALWLRGWATAKAGDAEEGKRIMDLAVLLPLADEPQRDALAEVVERHGLAEELRSSAG
ncbi:MAG TPA: hypothetical protein VMZ50_11430 [Phycisphaerae bacterium]|nr:hypothetical protein [Phycisphaerae bacterium]